MKLGFLTAPFFFAAFAFRALASDGCAMCETWNAPQKPFRIFGNAYYVGPHGLASILITSESGHILIDGNLPDSVPQIIANINALGFKPEDIKVLLNTHVHFDHAGGLAELQKITGAKVYASAASAPVLKSGEAGKDDPQYGTLPAMAPIAHVETFKAGQDVRVGALTLKPHATPGHTPGGTTWTWDSCEGARCLHMVYADSLTAVSADTYLFTRYPDRMKAFEQSFATVGALPCDILVSAHPEFSGLWDRLTRRDNGEAEALVDPGACNAYAAGLRKNYDTRIAKERAK